MTPKAWSYIRLSTAGQVVDGKDGEIRQTEASAAYAAKHGLDLQEPLQDLGVSAFRGKNRKRGDLGKFLAMVEAGIVPRKSYFLVENCDRFSREEPTQAFATFTHLINSDIVVVATDREEVFSRETLRKDPNKLVLWLLEAIRGHGESVRKAQMVTKAANRRKAAARASGKAISGNSVGWLRKLPGGGFEIDPAKGPIVQRIFHELDGGIGATKVALRLNEDGVKPFNNFKKRKTKGWHHGVVLSIAKNRRVLGEHQMTCLIEDEDGESIRVPDGEPIAKFYPVVIEDEALFYRVQAGIRERRESLTLKAGRRGETHGNLFGSLAKCTECYGTMLFRSAFGKTKAVLQCGCAQRKAGCASKRRFPYERIEDQVLRFVAELDLATPHQQDPALIELQLLAAQRDHAKARIANLLDMMEAGQKDVAERLRTRRSELDEIETNYAALNASSLERDAERSPQDHQEAVARLLAEMGSASGKELYALRARLSMALGKVVSKIEFYDEENYVMIRMHHDELAAYMLLPEGHIPAFRHLDEEALAGVVRFAS